MKQLIWCILLCFLVFELKAQDTTTSLSGKVTFVTENNVYVRFDSTEEIEIGDSLFINGNSCLSVSEKSSSSVVCTVINSCLVNKDDTVTATITIEEVDAPSEEIEDNVAEDIPAEVIQPQDTYPEQPSLYRENIRGRISVASYYSFSDTRDNRNRLQGRFSLNANHINDGKFSVETFLAYRSIFGTDETYTARTSIFNIYNLNLNYNATPSLTINVGRRINPKASTFGANDGLQVENYFGNFFVGGVVGFRPDFENYGFNSDLFQYGGYLGIESKSNNFYSTTTLGAMEQTLMGFTDRRYIFAQHNSTIAKNLNLFGSAEIDIYSTEGSETRLTNLYLSARYRFSRAANVMFSYDSRKRIIYYESFQSTIDQILAEDLARQGFRARLNVRPFKIVWAGVSYSSRFQSDEQNKSNNIYGYMTLTKIPGVGGRLNVAYNHNTSRYATNNVLSARHSRSLVKSKLQAEFYFRMAEYDYTSQLDTFAQNYYGIGLSWSITRTWQFNISGEYTQSDTENNTRIYAQLTKRFYSKKKK